MIPPVATPIRKNISATDFLHTIKKNSFHYKLNNGVSKSSLSWIFYVQVFFVTHQIPFGRPCVAQIIVFVKFPRGALHLLRCIVKSFLQPSEMIRRIYSTSFTLDCYLNFRLLYERNPRRVFEWKVFLNLQALRTELTSYFL